MYAKKETLKPWRILIVDDSPDDRAEIRRMLLNGSDRRLSFIEADTAQVGILAVLGAPQPPDCTVLDYNLPDLNGPEVLAALAGPHGIPVCPVLVITGGTNRKDGRRALRAGAQGYIGKDWSNPQALNRAVENACEIWALACELGQREDALRLIAERETFRSAFRNAMADLMDEHMAKRVASRLLGEYLKVDRVMYGEVLLGEATIVIGQSYVNDVPQIEGRHRLGDYGPQLQAKLVLGENLVVQDVRVDSAYSDSEKAAHAELEIVAILGIPILKNGSLAAVLGVHQKTRREWTPEDLLIAREIAERTWAAVEHARAEMSLLAKEAQLSQLMQMMPSFSAILAGPSFVFQMANNAYLNVVGRGPEIIGKTIPEVFPELVDQPFPALLQEVYHTGKSFEAKSMLAKFRREPSGSLVDIFVDFTFMALRGPDGQVSGIFIHGVDRTAEVRAADELARRERELSSLTENTPSALVRFDRQFRHVFANSFMEQVTGLASAEILGKSSRELGMPLEQCEELEKAILHVYEHKVCGSLDFSFFTPDGLRYFSCRLVPEFNERAEVETVLSVANDITDRKQIDRILQDKNIELESAIAVAEQANRAKSDFLSSMSHELRTPLNAILGFGQLLDSGLPTPTPGQKRSVDQILKAGWYLLELINEILDLAAVESGHPALSLEPVSIAEVMAECQNMVGQQAHGRGIKMVYAQMDTALCVLADRTRLKQVFVNLLSNAIKYNRASGSVFVDYVLTSPQWLRVSVRDTGLGLAPPQLARLFQPFNRLGREAGTEEGTGIGLVVTKRLIELMGGRMGVDSVVAQGSVFWFELELTAPAQLSAPSATEAGPVQLPTPKNALAHTLLYVEDNPANLELVRQLLKRHADLHMLTAMDATVAIELARAHLPHVILMDINLPGISGIEAMQILRADPLTAHIPIIAVSASASNIDINKGLKAGFFSYVTKPIRVDKLMESINEALACSQASTGRV